MRAVVIASGNHATAICLDVVKPANAEAERAKQLAEQAEWTRNFLAIRLPKRA